MTEDRLDARLTDAARHYHVPPEPPREAMWRGIEAARRAQAQRPATRPVIRWLSWSAAAAAILVLGIGIGRGWPSGAPAPTVTAAVPVIDSVGLGLRLAAADHLAQSETFLTLFRASVRSGADAALAPATARQLLASNRLLRDSRVGDDPAMAALLDDLELVLAQITQLPEGPRRREENHLITDGIERRAVLTRLQSVVPAGAVSSALIQGVL